MSLIAFALAFSLTTSPGLRGADRLTLANTQDLMGETGSLYILPEGAFVQPFYNDYAGETDKLLTHAGRISVLQRAGEGSLEARVVWRVFNPSFKERFGRAVLDEKPGTFADWGELGATYARAVALGSARIKLQAGVGVHHFGDKGAREMHVALHRLVGTTTEHLTYDEQLEGVALGGHAEVALILPEARLGPVRLAAATTVGGGSHEFMDELYVRENLTVDYRGIAIGAEAQLRRQIATRWLGEGKPYRYELALGLLAWERYRPSVKYVSDYLQGDDVGQLYVDLLNWTVTY